MNLKSGIFIFIILLLVVAAGIYWLGVRPSLAPVERGSEEVMPAGDAKDEILVDNQKPNTKTLISRVTLSQDGWVVIHESKDDKPGVIMAAARFDAGTHENREVDLLGKQTQEGKTYFAMLHSDDGDRKFDHTKDLPIKDPLGNITAMKFIATSSQNMNLNVDMVAKSFCGKPYGKQENIPVASVQVCDGKLRLVRQCCDNYDVVLDTKGQFLAECGGLKGYSEKCKKLINITACGSQDFCKAAFTGGGTFACGPDLVCDPTTQYCSAFFGGPGGVPPNYRCTDLPDDCPSRPTCECIPGIGIGYRCTESGGSITVTHTAP